MKKMIYMFGAFLMIVGIGMFVYYNSLLKYNKQTPAQRYNEEQQKEQKKNEFEDSEKEGTAEDVKGIILNNGFSVEFIDYSVVEGSEIENQTEYPTNNFYEGEYPSIEQTEEYVDYEAIEAECPELKEMWANLEKYSVEEVKRIYDENADIVEQHTHDILMEKKYIFIKCRIQNSCGRQEELFLSELAVVGTNNDFSEWTENIENIIYFDCSQNLQGEERAHSFFTYTMKKDEIMECTIGFEVDDIGENIKYYVGVIDTQMMETGENYTTGKDMFNLNQIREVSNEVQ